MKQQVTLAPGKIAEVKGTCYGPGTIEVAPDIAEILVKYHEAIPGNIITDDVTQLRTVAAGNLTPEQLRALLAQHEGTAPAAVTQTISTPATDQAQVTGMNGRTVVDEIMLLDVDEIRKQLGDRQVEIPPDVTEKVPLAILLAESAGYKGRALEVTGGGSEAEIPKGGLPAGFPGRAKLIKGGLTTMAKLVEAKPEDWPAELDQKERDQIAAELATL